MNASELQALFDAAGVQHFRAQRFLTLRQTGEVVTMPDAYADAAVRVCQLADTLRNRYGAPVRLANGYRPPDYNAAVGGAPKSQHIFGAAVDLDPLDGREAEFQALAAQLWLENPDQLAGLGVYNGGRIHLDVPNAPGVAARRSWPKDSELRTAALETAKTLPDAGAPPIVAVAGAPSLAPVGALAGILAWWSRRT